MYKILISLTVSAAIAFAAAGFRRTSIMSSGVARGSLPSAGPGFAVVELFTSEGCSSCPPADDILAKIAREYPDNVYVLGFHVDYWDRLGWKDIYSSADYTRRQQKYAQLFNLNSIYTPQAIVNGKHEYVGSNESGLRSAIEEGLAATPPGGRISLSAKCDDGKNIKVSYSVDYPGKTELQIALVQSQATSQVLRGENQGHRLHHINVVRSFQSASIKSGKGGIVDLRMPDGLQAKDCKIIAFLQDKEDERITKAAQVMIQ